MKEAQKYIIVKALYFTKNTSFTKEESKRAITRGLLRPTQGRSKRPSINKGKKSMFDKDTPFTTTRREILNQM